MAFIWSKFKRDSRVVDCITAKSRAKRVRNSLQPVHWSILWGFRHEVRPVSSVASSLGTKALLPAPVKE